MRKVNPQDQLMKDLILKESKIIEGDESCAQALDNVDGGAARSKDSNRDKILDQIDELKLKYQLTNHFYQPKYMKAISCMLKLGLVSDQSLTGSNYVRDFFTNTKKIGGDSVEGVAMLANVKGGEELFIIKAPKNPEVDNLTHEYFTANGGSFKGTDGKSKHLIGTNQLRSQCLNYAQILGGFRCGPPRYDKLTGKIDQLCGLDGVDPAQYVNYVIYEKIVGPDMAKAVTQMNKNFFIVNILQLAMALEIGQTNNGFTHYDLHNENVILRPVNPDAPDSGEVAYIPFEMDGQTIYILSSHIPTIIDFGRAHVQTPSPAEEKRTGIEAEHFGYYSSFALEYGIYGDEARPYYDIFKIIGFMLYSMADKNPSVFEEVWPIMKFFGMNNREDVLKWLTESRGSDLFSLNSPVQAKHTAKFCLNVAMRRGQACVDESGVSVMRFVEFIQREFPDSWDNSVFVKPGGDHKILKCSTDCMTFSQAILESRETDATSSIVNRMVTGFDRKNINGVLQFMEYRNNINQRYLYFLLNQRSKSRALELKDRLNMIDTGMMESDIKQLEGDAIKFVNSLNTIIRKSGLANRTEFVRDRFVDNQAGRSAGGLLNGIEEIVKFLGPINKYIDRITRLWEAIVVYRSATDTSIKPFRNFMVKQVNPLFVFIDTVRKDILTILYKVKIDRNDKESLGYRNYILDQL
tara:strand:- start:53853 stop:55925 length:2073 start_codon:yes stop_codon:yes gene_type:complete